MRPITTLVIATASVIASSLLTWALARSEMRQAEVRHETELDQLRSTLSSMESRMMSRLLQAATKVDALDKKVAAAGDADVDKDGTVPRCADARIIAAYLWRCLHDSDGVMAQLDARHLSPLDSSIMELTQNTFERLDKLQDLYKDDAHWAREYDQLVAQQDRYSKTGEVSEDRMAQIKQRIDELRSNLDERRSSYRDEHDMVIQLFAQRLPILWGK
jgi:hypothetical protein